MATITALFLDTTTGSLKGISSTADQALVAGIQSGAATDLSLIRAGAVNSTIAIGAAGTTYGSDLIAFGVSSTTFNLANTVATTVNFAGAAATALNMGNASGTTTINGSTVVSGTLAANGAAITTDDTTFALLNTTATTINFAGAASTAVNIGNASGTTTIAGIGTVAGVLNANGGSIVTDDTTFALVNTTATTVNFAGAGTTVSIGNASGTTTINNANTVVTGDLTINGGDLAAAAGTFNLLNSAVTTLNIGAAATAINMGVNGGLTTVTGNARVTGNLTVVGTTFTTESETVLINDNHLYLNNAYTTAAAQTGGLVVNYLPTATADTVAAGGFATTSTIATTGAATFSAGNIVQVSGATNPANNGIYEVLTHSGNVLTIDTSPTEDFLQNAFVVSVGAVGAITRVNVSVMRSGTDGLWEVGQGSATPITFSDLATGSSSGWTDDGTVVRLTTVTDNVGIGTATPGTNKLNITNDTTGDRNLLLAMVAAQTASPFRIETSAAAQLFEVEADGDTVVTGDLAVNGATSADITTTTTTGTLFNTGATTLSVGGAATALSLGAATGTLTIGNPTITGTNATALNLNGASPSIATTSTTASVFNATVTTLNIGGAGTTVSIGAATGTTTINNANTVVAGSLAANGAAITTDDTTFALLNTTATTINFGGAATTINAGAAASTFATGFNAVTSSQTTVSLFNTTTTTLNVGGAATTMSVGNSGGTVTLPGNLTVNGSVTLGDAAADNVAVNGEFTTGLIPDVTNTVSLGSATKRWASLFVTNLDSLSVGTTYVAASTITAARVVFKNATANEVAHADATSITSGSNKIVGVARAGAAATADVTVDYAGVVTMDAATGITITAGDLVYLSTAAGTGEVTNVAPSTSGQVVVVVGVAKTTSASGGTFLAQLAPRTPFEIP